MSNSIISSIMALKELDILKESALFLAKTRPFVYNMLMSLKWIPKSGITMGVGIHSNRPVLYYSPDFVKLVYSLNPQSLINVIKHEILHIALRHLDTDSSEVETRVIKDLIINGILREVDPCQTPAVVPCPMCTPTSGNLKSYIEDSAALYSNTGKCRMPDDECAHCHGAGDLGLYIKYAYNYTYFFKNLNDDRNLKLLYEKYKAKYGESSRPLSELLLTKYSKEEAEFLTKCFGQNDGIISIELGEGDEEAEHYIKACISSAASSAGTDSELTQQILVGSVNYSKKLDWRKYLRNSICNSISVEDSSTRLKRNRRFGFSQPGTRKMYSANVVVAIDTSASMTDNTLAEIKSIVLGLKPLGVNATILEFDTEISAEYGIKNINNAVTGRGGTNLAAPLYWAVENSAGYGTSIFIFTDGFGPAHIDPNMLRGYKVYWMLTSCSTDKYIKSSFESEKNHKITKFDL